MASACFRRNFRLQRSLRMRIVAFSAIGSADRDRATPRGESVRCDVAFCAVGKFPRRSPGGTEWPRVSEGVWLRISEGVRLRIFESVGPRVSEDVRPRISSGDGPSVSEGVRPRISSGDWLRVSESVRLYAISRNARGKRASTSRGDHSNGSQKGSRRRY